MDLYFEKKHNITKHKFSIIIPHLNEWYFLDIMLDSFYNYIKYDDYEIIICDDGSDNETYLKFINNHFLKDKIKVYKNNGLWLANNKNFWASKASWDILVFLDSHMYVKDDILEKINKILINKTYISLLQPVIWSIQNKRVRWEIYKIKDYSLNSTWDFSKNKSNLVETPNIAWWATVVRKKVFENLWWFNKNFRKWWVEDLDFSMRAWLSGYTCYLAKDIKINHYFKVFFKNTTVISEDVLFNKIIFALTCFRNKSRRKKILENLKENYKDIFDSIYDKVINSEEIRSLKHTQINNLVYDDDWYFEKFERYYDWIDK